MYKLAKLFQGASNLLAGDLVCLDENGHVMRHTDTFGEKIVMGRALTAPDADGHVLVALDYSNVQYVPVTWGFDDLEIGV